MVTLNHAVAVGMADGPRAGLDMLAALDGDRRLAGHHRIAPCAPTCSSAPATSRRRSRPTGRRPAARRACPSSAI